MKRLFSLVALCLGLTLPAMSQNAAPVSAVPAKPAPTNPIDDRIYDEVRRKLADDADVKGGALDVTVHDGAITLRGRVRDQKAREKAARIAKKVKGAMSVDNQLKLFSEE